jgi:hypothetical protein
MEAAHVRVYAYVNYPYVRVAEMLRRDPTGIFQRATASATTRANALVSTLRAGVGGIEVAADVVVTVRSVHEDPLAPLGRTTRVALAWSFAGHPELFPTMDATLAVYPLSPTETQLDFDGDYRLPLGAIGAAVNVLIGHRLAEASVHRFVEDVRERLRFELAQLPS